MIEAGIHLCEVFDYLHSCAIGEIPSVIFRSHLMYIIVKLKAYFCSIITSVSVTVYFSACVVIPSYPHYVFALGGEM